MKDSHSSLLSTRKADTLLSHLRSITLGKNEKIFAQSAGFEDDVVKLLVPDVSERNVVLDRSYSTSALQQRRIESNRTDLP